MTYKKERKTISKYIINLLLCASMFIGNMMPLYAASEVPNDGCEANATIDSDGILDFGMPDYVNFVEVFEGRFVAEFSIVAENPGTRVLQEMAIVQVILDRDFHMWNFFEVSYSIHVTSLGSFVSGYRGTITISNASALDPHIISTIAINDIFPAATIHHSGRLRTIFINSNVSSVRVQTSGTSLHFMRSGWVPQAIQLNGVIHINW